MPVEQRSETLGSVVSEPLLVQVKHIPHELTLYRQWICWRYVARDIDKKPAKEPVNPSNIHHAGVQWSNTWSDFGTAYETYLAHRTRGIAGIGFVLTVDDPFVAVDLDDCIQDDTIEEYAAVIVEGLNSYTEVSPSGQGIRILVACADFQENVRRPQYEIYSHDRYVTVTGRHIAGTANEIAAVALEQLAALFPQSAPEPAPTPSRAIESKRYATSDPELWERIFAHDQFGAQHLRRFQGDTSLDRDDHSFTVIRLLNCLARWTRSDASGMRAMMLMSPLANEKWFEKRNAGDWLNHQIADAIAYVCGRKGNQ